MTSAEISATAPGVRLPSAADVADILGTLLGIPATATLGDAPSQTAAYALSLHISPEGKLVGAMAADIELAASSGVAIAGQSPRNAEDAIHKGNLGLDLWDNFREVSNVLNVLLTDERRNRVILHSVQRVQLHLWSRLQHAAVPSVNFLVDIEGYPSARLSVFSLSDLEDPELVELLRTAGEEAAAHDMQVVGGKLIRLYDFRKPKGIERAQMNALRTNLGIFTKSAAAAMSEMLQSAVHIKLVQLHHQGWDDYAGTLDNNAFITTFRLDPLPSHFILTFSPGLSVKCLDCRLSGSEQPGSIRRSLTDLDVALLAPMVKSVINDLASCFTPFLPVRAQVVRHVTEKFMMEGATLSLTWLVAWMTVSIGGSTFDASLCFPIVPLQPVLIAMAEAAQHGEHLPADTPRTPVGQVMDDIDVELVAHFPSVRLSMHDMTSLKPGSTLHLDVDRTASLVLSSGGRPLASIDPVVIGRRLNVQISELIEDPELFFLA